MKAFHSDQAIKDKYLSRVKAHQLADEIVKGIYWEEGKGCAVGCTIHSSDHNKFETELGIPKWLALLEDRIFEGLPNDRAKIWPQEFLEAIPIGVDLEQIKAPFLIFVIKSTLDKFNHKKYPKVLESILNVIALYENGEIDIEKFKIARANAANAAYAADAAYAAANAANAAAAYAAAAANAAANAANAANAADAADAAAAANAAAYAAAYAAYPAAAYARQKTYVKFADELLRLLRECK